MRFAFFTLVLFLVLSINVSAKEKVIPTSNATKDSISQVLKMQGIELIPDSLIRIAMQKEIQNLPVALAYCELAKEISQKNQIPAMAMRCTRMQGIIFEMHNQIDSANVYQLEVMDLSQQIPDPEGTMAWITAAIDLAILNYEKAQRYDLALEWYEAALEKAKSIDDKEQMIYCYFGIGKIHQASYQYEEAISWFYQALSLAKTEANHMAIVSTMHTIGLVHLEMEQIDVAEEIFLEAKSHLDGVPDFDPIEALYMQGNHYLNAGKSQVDQNKWVKAMEYFNYALDFFEKVNNPRDIATTKLYLSRTILELGDHKKAMAYIEKLEANSQFLGIEEQARLYNTLGRIHLKQKQTETATTYFKQSLAITTTEDFKSIAQENYQALFEIEQNQEDYKTALQYHIALGELDSIRYNTARNQDIAKMRFKYQMSNKERQINQLKNEKQLVTFASILGFLTVALLIVIYLFRSRMKNNQMLKEKNAAITQQLKRLEESHHALEQFAFVAAHDLKEPLRTIGSFSSLIKRRGGRQSEEERKEYLNFITNAARKLTGLLDDLLLYATIAREMPVQEKHTLKNIIKLSVNHLSQEIAASNAKVEVDISNELALMGKEDHFCKVIHELILNGIKFNHQQPIIKIESKQVEDQIRVTVTDNGIGMEEHYQHKVFNIFHRLDKQSNRSGRGVGLSICKNIIEKYNGSITYHKLIKGGTQFVVTLPAPSLRV